MLPVSAQDSMEGESSSVASSSLKTLQTPIPHRKSSLDNETSATKVFVRVRPFSAAERRQSRSGDPPAIVTVSDDNPCHITTLDPSKQFQPKSTYVFDRCFNSALIKPAAGDDAQLLLPYGRDASLSAVTLSTLEDVAAEALLNPLQLDCLARDQAVVYGYVGRPVLLNALAGYNGCVFAYGQTGSGKTYTMMGPPGTFGAVVTNTDSAAPSASGKKFRRAATGYAGLQQSAHDTSSVDDASDSRFQSCSSMTPRVNANLRTSRVADASSPLENDFITPRGDRTSKSSGAVKGGGGCGNAGAEGDESLQGIVPRLVRELFDELHLQRERDSSHSFRVEVEYYEIYREKVMDLLGSHSAGTNTELRVRQSKISGPYVENLKKKHVEDERHVFRLLRQGNLRRHTAATAMNDRSSRSHAIFVLHLVQMHITDQDSTSAKVTSKVNLVDLAGSEKTGARNAEGDQFKEGVVINVSLTVLGRVIDALADKSQGKRNVFCPYRDSVLTWLLMDSLGGNSKTTMVATVSPHCMNFEEACQTLRYASRAKQIVTKVVVNEDPQVRQIKMLTAEVQRLKALLAAEGRAADNDEDVEALQDRIHALEEELNSTRNELEEKAAELSNLQALRRITSSVPSTLKAGNAGTAGAAKELSKAKSDVRRLEAENLLHLQTEEELHRSLERVKALELKYTQLLSDLKEAQESSKKLEKDKQERDKRILELQQQLFQERTKLESPQAASSPLVSPGGASAHSAATVSTTGLSPTSMTKAGMPVSPSPTEKQAARKATPVKKTGKKAKSSGGAGEASAEWEAEKAELCSKFDEERKLLSLQVQERTDAFRKSQLDVKKVKAELKTTQDTLQVLEKRLNDHYADVVRRLQEELQDLRRTLKDERKSNKDIRQLMAGPVEERPAFSFAYVADALVEHERTVRDDVVAEEKLSRTLAEQAIQLTRRGAEREACAAATHVAEVAALQAEAALQAKAMAELQAKWEELEVAHARLQSVHEEDVTATGDLKTQLADLQESSDSAEAVHKVEMAKLEEQLDALRELTAEQQDSAAAQTKRVHELKEQVGQLSAQLENERQRFREAAAEHERQVADKANKAAAAAAALEATHLQQLRQLRKEHDAESAEAHAKAEKTQEQLQATQAELCREKEARHIESQRFADMAAEHANVVADLRSELARVGQCASTAAEAHAAELHSVEEQLAQKTKEAADSTASLQQHADELKRTLEERTAGSDAVFRGLNAQLSAAHAELSKSEEARKAQIQRSVEQAKEHEAQLSALREELRSTKADAQAAADEHDTTVQQLREEQMNQQQRSEETCGFLSDQIAGLQAQLSELEGVRQAEARRGAEESAAQQVALDTLRADLEKQKAAEAALIAAHADEVRKLHAENARNAEVAHSSARELTEQLSALRSELETSRAELQHSEEARRHQIERSLQQAAEHSTAMEQLRAQLAAAQGSAVDAAAAHEQRVRDLECALASQQAAAAEAAAALQTQLDEVQSALQNEQACGREAAAVLEKDLSAAREEVRKSEEARKAQIQRSVEQAKEHDAQLSALREEMTAKLANAETIIEERAKEAAALQDELRAAATLTSARISTLTTQLQSQEEQAHSYRSKMEGQLASLTTTLATTESELLHSQQAHKEAVEKALSQSKEHGETLAALQQALERERKEAVLAAASHKKELQDVVRRLEQTTASGDATTAALHKELDLQRQAAAAEAAQHVRSLKELEDRLAAAQSEAHRLAAARNDDQERSAKEVAQNAATIKDLQRQLAEAEQAKTASAAIYEVALERLQVAQAKMTAENTAVVTELQQELCRAQAELARSEQARNEQAEEGMQQAEAHTKSLESLQRMLESRYKQQVAALEKSHADYVASLEAQLASQTSSAQSLREDLSDARGQIKQMVETQNYLGKQLEEEKQTNAELRGRADSTEKARAMSAAEAVHLRKELTSITIKVNKLTEEKAGLTQKLQDAWGASASTQQQLVDQQRITTELDQRVRQQAAELTAAQTTIASLRVAVSKLEREKEDLLHAQETLTEQQREQLVTQQVDMVTELEAQFRAMESERRAVEEKARQTEEALRTTIEKQATDLRQLRENLDFNISMNLFEVSDSRRGVSTVTVNPGGGASAAPPLVGGGIGKTFTNGSFASRPASPAVGGAAATGGVAGMLSSFFRRGTTGAAPTPTTHMSSAGPHGTPQVVQRHGSVLHALGEESRNGATTPVRRGSNFYTTSAFRPPSVTSLFSKAEANASGTGTQMLGTRTPSNTSLDTYVVEPESASWHSPAASHAPNNLLPPE
jgi:chromosome segregation ATPase